MTRTRLLIVLVSLAVLAATLVVWAVWEARRQRVQSEASLRDQAAVLARSLGPSLAAASAAARELDEVVAWRLLDNARLVGRLDAAGGLGRRELEELIDSNDLDVILLVDSRGRVRRRAGPTGPPGLLLPEVLDVAAGRASEVVVDWPAGEGRGHMAAAAARPGGGAVVVSAHASTAYAFANRLGVENLLDATVGTGGVLYLAYSRQPGGEPVEVSWDGGPVPPVREEKHAVRQVREKSTFEVEVQVPTPVGESGSLRVGLDAAPLLQTSVSAARRTALVGIVLAAFGLAGTGFAVVSRARMRERAEAERRLAALDEKRRRSERLAAAGALAAGLAHEIRNPLNAISLAAQRIVRQPVDESDCLDFAAGIRSEVGRLEEILKGFLDLARPAAGPRSVTDLRELAGEVTGLLEAEAAPRRVALGVEVPGESIPAEVDREALRRAIVNLVRNALDFSPEGTRVTVAVDRDGDLARVRVLDEGSGIEPNLGEQVFDPFFTTRADGIGLGLPMVRRVAEEHGGWARLAARPSGGTEAILELPVVEEGA
jgi:signal transduction histidine kinase